MVAGGVCMVAGGGHAWLRGAGMRGCLGVCVVARGACVVAGGVCGCWGACMIAGGACMVAGGVHRIRQDTVNEWAVRILLECILVLRKILVMVSFTLPSILTIRLFVAVFL